jgi:hypothetical protein
VRQLPFQLLAPRVELDHPVFDLLRGHARDDRIHQLLMIPFCAGQCLFLFLAAPGGRRLQNARDFSLDFFRGASAFWRSRVAPAAASLKALRYV